MIRKKICMLGAFSVGKTSLIGRYVKSIFSEKYLTTVGVKIEKKAVEVNGQDIQLMIWDLAGKDDFTDINMSYLRGAAGFILVIDPTRPATFQVAIDVLEKAITTVATVPVTVALNKADLKADWQVDENSLEILKQKGCELFETSAKDGTAVEALFESLTRQMLNA